MDEIFVDSFHGRPAILERFAHGASPFCPSVRTRDQRREFSSPFARHKFGRELSVRTQEVFLRQREGSPHGIKIERRPGECESCGYRILGLGYRAVAIQKLRLNVIGRCEGGSVSLSPRMSSASFNAPLRRWRSLFNCVRLISSDMAAVHHTFAADVVNRRA